MGSGGRIRPARVSVIAVVLGIAVLAGGVVASPAAAEDRFTGIVQSTGAADAGLSQFRLLIEQYSTREETLELLKILAEDGWRQLENKLVATERARFILPGQLGHNIGFADSTPAEDGGRVIHLVSARPLFLFEALGGTRSREYPFGVIEIRLDADGKGDGSVFAAAKIQFNNDGNLVIESWGIPPYSISEIEQQN